MSTAALNSQELPGEPLKTSAKIPSSTAVWLFEIFASICRLPFDRALFAQNFPHDFADADIECAAQGFGLVVEKREGSLESVLAWRLPVAIRLRSPLTLTDSAKDSTGAGSHHAYAIVLNASDQNVALITPDTKAPTVVSIGSLRSAFAGEGFSLRPSTEDVTDSDGIDIQHGKFGLRWFIPQLRKHKAIWRQVVLASLVIQLMALAMPLFTQVIIDKVIVHHTQSTLIALGLGLLVFLIFTSVLSWVRQYVVLHTGRRIDAALGSHVFSHLLKLPLIYFNHRPTGVIAARLQGIESIREFVASALVTLVLDVPFLLIFLAIMLYYSVTLSLIVMGILVVLCATSFLMAPAFQQLLDEQFRRGATQQAFITEHVSAMETVKALQLEPQLNHRFRNQLEATLDAGFRTRQLANSYGTIASTLEQLMNTCILLIGAWIAMSGSAFTVGMLVAFQMFSSRISQPMLRMVGLWQQWQQTRLAVARLGDVMNAPAESYSLVPRHLPGSGPAAVEFREVAFRYSQRLPLILDGFSLKIPAGQLVALMGPSGAGKSTITKLLQGFHAPSAGSIRIDGIDHSYLAANELRAQFGIVPQETVLFSGSLFENLRLASPQCSMEQIVAACQMAEIHSFIEQLPDGYQTIVGERGCGLSGGQRQRLAIARALLRGPRLLIFDESTSSVDATTAEQLGKTINALKGRTTILFIAHQLPRSIHPDQVVRLGEKLAVVQASKSDLSGS